MGNIGNGNKLIKTEFGVRVVHSDAAHTNHRASTASPELSGFLSAETYLDFLKKPNSNYGKVLFNFNNRDDVQRKFDLFNQQLKDPKINEYYKEAMALEHIGCGYDSFENYSIDAIRHLIKYFNYEYKRYASFNKLVIKSVERQIEEVVNKYEIDVNGVYDISFKRDLDATIHMIANREREITPDVLAAIEKYYPASRIPAKTEIHKIYRDVLNIGAPLELSDDRKKEELSKVIGYINGEDFQKRYGHKFNIVDLYLSSNLQVEDIVSISTKYCTKEELITVKRWINSQVQSLSLSKEALSSVSIKTMFSKPCGLTIENMAKGSFIGTVSLPANQEDAIKAKMLLNSLNEKFGVKYDDLSLHIILQSVIKKEEKSYRIIGEEHKSYLDEVSYVDKSVNPIFTRRKLRNEE